MVERAALTLTLSPREREKDASDGLRSKVGGVEDMSYWLVESRIKIRIKSHGFCFHGAIIHPVLAHCVRWHCLR